MSNTIEDFWRMVWQERAITIFMLCDIQEENKVKCAPYWPQCEDETLDEMQLLSVCNIQIGRHGEAEFETIVLEVTEKDDFDKEQFLIQTDDDESRRLLIQL